MYSEVQNQNSGQISTADLDARQRTGLHNHGKVHKGFQGELEKVWNDLKRQINYILEGSYDIDIHITGHSLGGAMRLSVRND